MNQCFICGKRADPSIDYKKPICRKCYDKLYPPLLYENNPNLDQPFEGNHHVFDYSGTLVGSWDDIPIQKNYKLLMQALQRGDRVYILTSLHKNHLGTIQKELANAGFPQVPIISEDMFPPNETDLKQGHAGKTVFLKKLLESHPGQVFFYDDDLFNVFPASVLQDIYPDRLRLNYVGEKEHPWYREWSKYKQSESILRLKFAQILDQHNLFALADRVEKLN